MRLGRSSLVISLPNVWTKINKLSKGDRVSMMAQRDGSLLVLPGARKEMAYKRTSLVIEQDEDENFIIRKITACYLNGYDAIEVLSPKFFPSEQQKAIRKAVSSLGMSIMETDTRRVYVESLIDESKVSVSRTLRRIHVIVLSMCQGIIDVLKDWNMELARSIYGLDDDVDQFTRLLLRLSRKCVEDPVLMIEVGLEPGDCLDIKMLAHELEHIADCSVDMALRALVLHSTDQKIPEYLLEPLLEMHELACKLYDESMKAFFSLDIGLANKVIDSAVEVEELSKKASELLIKETNSAVVCTFCHLRHNVENIVDHSTDIAELVIDRGYSSTVEERI